MTTTTGCEGGCGCRLARYGFRELWEMSTSRDGDPVSAVARHTPERCAAIRVLRDAALRAAGSAPVYVAATSEGEEELLTVGVGVPGGDCRWADVTWTVADLLGVGPTESARLGQLTEEALAAILSGVTPDRDYPTDGTVVARDPRSPR